MKEIRTTKDLSGACREKSYAGLDKLLIQNGRRASFLFRHDNAHNTSGKKYFHLR